MDSSASKHKGAHSELIACTWLLEQGYDVFRNISAYGFADLIAVRHGGTLLLDVKTMKRCREGRGPAISQEQATWGVAVLIVANGQCRIEMNSRIEKRPQKKRRAVLSQAIAEQSDIKALDK